MSGPAVELAAQLGTSCQSGGALERTSDQSQPADTGEVHTVVEPAVAATIQSTPPRECGRLARGPAHLNGLTH